MAPYSDFIRNRKPRHKRGAPIQSVSYFERERRTDGVRVVYYHGYDCRAEKHQFDVREIDWDADAGYDVIREWYTTHNAAENLALWRSLLAET